MRAGRLTTAPGPPFAARLVSQRLGPTYTRPSRVERTLDQQRLVRVQLGLEGHVLKELCMRKVSEK